MLRRVKAPCGEIQGYPGGDPRVTVFRGIPYAEPPVGALRWRAPQPVAGWERVYKAKTFQAISYQNQPGADPNDFWTRELHPTASEYPRDEDCLYLNVWTPAISPEDRLPVLFYIHGGGFAGGYSYEMEFDGEGTARQGVILVTVGYRLGVFGFFSHPLLAQEDREAPANFGLLDMVCALEWVHRNIAAFGGDPDRITIAGQSAGAFAVTALTNTARTEGLIAGAIAQSGGGILPLEYHTSWQTISQAQENGCALFEKLGVSTLEQARALPAEAVYSMAGTFPGMCVWNPCTDGVLLREDPYLSQRRNHNHRIPYLLSNTAGEWHMGPLMDRMPQTVEDFEADVRSKYGVHAQEYLDLCGVKSEEDLLRLYRTDAYNSFAINNRLYAELAAGEGRTAYLCVFDHDVPGEGGGAYHGSELWFAYSSLGRCWRPFTGKHYDLARQISGYWMNFVRSGDPNGRDKTGEPLPPWRPYDRKDAFVMRFESEPRGTTGRDPVLDYRIRFNLGEIDS